MLIYVICLLKQQQEQVLHFESIKCPQVAMFFLSLPLVGADFATCASSDEWSAFRGQVLQTPALRGVALAKRARGLVKRWKLPAEQWVTWRWIRLGRSWKIGASIGVYDILIIHVSHI